MARQVIVSFLIALCAAVLVLCASSSPLLFAHGWSSFFPSQPEDSVFSTVYWNPSDAQRGYKALTYGYADPAAPSSIPVVRVAATTELNNGWHGLYVKVDDSTLQQAAKSPALMNATFYAAGFAEGFATSELIYYSYYNQHVDEIVANMTTDARKWIDTHLAFMQSNVQAKGATDNYWAQVGKILLQIEGMTDGYNAGQNQLAVPKPLQFLDIFMLSFIDEAADVERSAFILNGKEVPLEIQQRLKREGEHCSALVKLVNKDVFIAHATWASLGGLLRTYKTYHFGTVVLQMSSYPGNVASDDDFYYINNGLVAQETTNHNHNNSNTAATQPYSVSEFIRALAASYLSAGEPSTWTTLFCQDNSGTYNNQYMVLQLQGFIAGTNGQAGTMKQGSFYVAEQMPGACIHKDQTQHLNTNTYWASYNRPFYPEIFAGMNWTSMEKLSSYYSYGNNYRALIFAREQSKVKSLDDVKALMRYNDYKNDDLSVVPNCTECWPQHTPYLSIAARCDLVPANGTFGVLDGEISLQDEAAIDAKVTSLTLFRNNRMSSVIASGPPFGGPSQLPPFSYKTTKLKPVPRRMGLPDVIQYNYTASNTLLDDAPMPIPDFTRIRGARVTVSAIVSAQTFVRATFGETFREMLIGQLGYTDPTGQTTITLTGAYWYDVSISAALTIDGPEAANWMNRLLREPVSRLSLGAVKGVSFIYTPPTIQKEEKSSMWIIGVVVASMMGILIIMLLVNHIRKQKSLDEEQLPFH